LTWSPLLQHSPPPPPSHKQSWGISDREKSLPLMKGGRAKRRWKAPPWQLRRRTACWGTRWGGLSAVYCLVRHLWEAKESCPLPE
jgi:hypothetical protein